MVNAFQSSQIDLGSGDKSRFVVDLKFYLSSTNIVDSTAVTTPKFEQLGNRVSAVWSIVTVSAQEFV